MSYYTKVYLESIKYRGIVDWRNNMKSQKYWKDLSTNYVKVMDDPWMKLVAAIQDRISVYTVEFYEKKGMKTLHLPITTGTISSPMGLGSDSLPVKINMFGVETYLADSMQFMLEYGCRIFEEGCYYIMPSFRGENADDRHLCQFYHSEAEIIGGLKDVQKLIGEYITYISTHILEELKDDIAKVTNGDVSHIEYIISLNGEYPIVTMKEAINILSEKYSEESDLFKEHEAGFAVLTAKGEKKLIEHFGGVVWLTHFEHLSVPFYQAFANDKTAMNADLLFGIGETVGCGERHASYEDVKKALELHQVNEEEYEWYCNMKKIKPLQTSGFGMGIERYILWLLRHDDIRDCQLLPRFNGEICMP